MPRPSVIIGFKQVKITIIFPGRSLETAKPSGSVMPLAPTLLAALTPDEHEVSLVDMFFGDQVDYESDVDVVAITVRTPLADIAYEIADNFLKREKIINRDLTGLKIIGA